jgi:hypothetical protein
MNMIRRGLELIFRGRDFGLLMGTQFFAQAGDGIVQAAIAKSIVFGGQKGFDLEGARSPDELLRIALYILVPYTILSPFLGVVIDRWDRRRLLMLANGLRAGAVLAVGLIGTESVSDVALFLAFLLTLSSTRVVLATKAAAIPATVDNHQLVDANAASQLGGALFQVGGAGLSLVAAGVISTDPIVIFGALVYGVGAAFPSWIRRIGETRVASTLGEEVARVAGRIVDGVREVARTPKAGAAISSYFWLRLLWSYTLVGIGFIVRRLVGGDDDIALAIIAGAGALGAVLGFVLADRARERTQSSPRLVLAASVVAGGAVTLLGPFRSMATLGVLAFFLGLGFFLAKISLDTMVQEALGDDFRGRAFSLYDIAYNLAWVVAAGAMKVGWGEVSEGALIAGMGVVFLTGVAGIGAWYRRAGLLDPAYAAAPAAR